MVGGAPGVTLVDIPTNDSWIRDTGPVFLVPGKGADLPPAAVTWEWNAWGGKYPPWDADAQVARSIAAREGCTIFAPGIILEGGAIETDGEESPLYKTLTTQAKPNGDVKWNFEKFIIGKDGAISGRFATAVKPDDQAFVKAIEAELKK